MPLARIKGNRFNESASACLTAICRAILKSGLEIEFTLALTRTLSMVQALINVGFLAVRILDISTKPGVDSESYSKFVTFYFPNK